MGLKVGVFGEGAFGREGERGGGGTGSCWGSGVGVGDYDGEVWNQYS